MKFVSKYRKHISISILEIKFEKKNILFKNGGQNKFGHIAQ